MFNICFLFDDGPVTTQLDIMIIIIIIMAEMAVV